METLRELRKFGGFAELENKGTNCANDTDTDADTDNKHARMRPHAHPAILLDIIETMIIAKNNPNDSRLQQKFNEFQSPDDILNDMIAKLDTPRELDAEIKYANSLAQTIFQMNMGLNFILARSGRLRTVKISNDYGSLLQAIEQINGGSSCDSVGASPHGPRAQDLIAQYQDKIDQLLDAAELLLTNSVICNCSNITQIIGTIPNPNDLPTEPEINMEKISASASASANALDQYLARAIHVAKIARNIEDYLIALRDFTKKICTTLGVVLAQCIVLISSRAMIA